MPVSSIIASLKLLPLEAACCISCCSSASTSLSDVLGDMIGVEGVVGCCSESDPKIVTCSCETIPIIRLPEALPALLLAVAADAAEAAILLRIL